MTEDVELVEQAETPDEAPQAEPANDMLPKSTVSKIVERERLKAFEKGKKEALMEFQQQQTQQPVEQQQPQQAQSLGGMQQMSPQEIEQLIMQKAPEALMQQVNQLKQKNMVDSFVNKMQAAEQRHPGLEAKLNKLNYDDPAMHSLIELTNNLENTGDIMKELVDNPSKMTQVLMGIERQPYLAQEQLISLSNSIKQNQEALAKEAQARDPMSQLKPSTNAGMDDGKESSMTTSDFRKILRQR